ncbi:phage terminase large subunit [Anaeromyxobacter oryzisoli]|uniref:phage terminase large subunit n=1 Tax=Anaeromyxobacter oryzisoli TaxID=2925408 RepID=UPI001F5970B8|nr:phage terminase large subunit [Anaeromyxobacter sp. SG63]
MAEARRYVAAPTLRRFQRSDAFVRCVVGPVGSGKSSACVIELLRRAMRQAPGPDGVRRSRWVVIRNTYSQLRDTTRKTFEEWVPAEIGSWNEQAFTWVGEWSDGEHPVHCEVLFRSLNRPEDVKKLLSLELTGAYVNESREIPKAVVDVLEQRVGRFPAKKSGGPTWSGIWMDTNPWAKQHWGYKLFTLHQGVREEDRDLYELFEQPGGRSPEAENLENLPPGYYDRLVVGKDAEWIKSYVDGEYPSNDQGSIFGPLIEKLEQRGGIGKFKHPTDGVFTSWDLGFSDATGIWFWRVNEHGVPDLIDHYEAHGQPLSHYFDEVDRRGYEYVKHWLPHDARARTLQTGSSILEQFVVRYGADRVAIGPELSLLDGIQAARWLLEQPVRFHERCAAGIEALRSYHYAWDEEARAFSRRPEHDWSSHTADAFRYVACVAKETRLIARGAAIVPPPPAARDLRTITMDELWTMRPKAQRTRRV